MRRSFLMLAAMVSLTVSAECLEFDLTPQGVEVGDDKPMLYVYPARQPNGTAIVMCPGGGYGFLAMDHEGRSMADWFNTMGVTYAIVKYRMPAGCHEMPLADVEQAMRIVRGHAAEWGVDTASVGIMGASAGGHLASTLATHYSSPLTRPDFQILFYPVVSMADGVTHPGSRDNLMGANPDSSLINHYSNELCVTPQTPQAFIMASTDDTVVPVENSLRYYKALAENGVSVAMHLYPTGNHGWGYNENFVYKRDWTGELEKWLRTQVFK